MRFLTADIIIEKIRWELHGKVKQNKTNIHIEEILEEMYEIWSQNQLENEEKKPYIELYFFICIGFGYLKVLCKNLEFCSFRVEYDKVINFFKKYQIQYNKNPLLKAKEIFKQDKNNRILTKLFFLLDKCKLGKVSLFLYNQLTK